MSERRVTLSAIAGKTGAHVTMDSLALRNHPRRPEATRRRRRTASVTLPRG